MSYEPQMEYILARHNPMLRRACVPVNKGIYKRLRASDAAVFRTSQGPRVSTCLTHPPSDIHDTTDSRHRYNQLTHSTQLGTHSTTSVDTEGAITRSLPTQTTPTAPASSHNLRRPPHSYNPRTTPCKRKKRTRTHFDNQHNCYIHNALSHK